MPDPVPAPISPVTHLSPSGITESCNLLTPFPFTPPDVTADPTTPRWYRDDDADTIAHLCALDLYADAGTAVCPKLAWTTPALELYDLTNLPKTTKTKFEQRACSIYHRRGAPKLAKIKFPTYAKENEAALLYFHFSRLLGNAGFVVPVTARTVAREELVRWTGEALAHITKAAYTGTPQDGWEVLQHRHKKSKLDSVEGALSKNPHNEHTHKRFRYYPGTKRPIYRAADFRKQDFYQLVASDDPIALDATSPRKYRARVQLLAYAQDFTDLVILDRVFHQRDRIGNIDAKPWHHFVDGGHLRWSKDPPSGASIKLERILLKDNDDALVWNQWGKQDVSPLVDELHHLDPITYARIEWLAGLMRDHADDVKAYFVDVVHVGETTYDDVRERFLDVADRFAAAHDAGDLALDLDLEAAIAGLPAADAPEPPKPPHHHHHHVTVAHHHHHHHHHHR